MSMTSFMCMVVFLFLTIVCLDGTLDRCTYRLQRWLFQFSCQQRLIAMVFVNHILHTYIAEARPVGYLHLLLYHHLYILHMYILLIKYLQLVLIPF